MPDSSQVHVWWAEFAGIPVLPGHLTEAERARAATMLPDVARTWMAGRTWIRSRLSAHLRCAPSELPLGYAAHGAPVLEALPRTCVSIAHSRSVVALAVGPTPLGVDVEDLPAPDLDLWGVAGVVATTEEMVEFSRVPADELHTAFTRWWVRKEAVLKAEGTGFLADPAGVHVGVTDVRPPAPWRVMDRLITPRTHVAVAVQRDVRVAFQAPHSRGALR